MPDAAMVWELAGARTVFRSGVGQVDTVERDRPPLTDPRYHELVDPSLWRKLEFRGGTRCEPNRAGERRGRQLRREDVELDDDEPDRSSRKRVRDTHRQER